MSGSTIDAELSSALPSTVAAVLGPNVGRGSRLPGSPDYALNAWINIEFPLFGELTGAAFFDVRHVDKIKTFIDDPDSLDLEAYNIGTLLAERWEVGVFVRNLWDERAVFSRERESSGLHVASKF